MPHILQNPGDPHSLSIQMLVKLAIGFAQLRPEVTVLKINLRNITSMMVLKYNNHQ